MKKMTHREYARKRMRRRMRVKEMTYLMFAVSVFLLLWLFAYFFAEKDRNAYDDITSYAENAYNRPIKEVKLYASDLCVAASDVKLSGYEPDESLFSAALFDTGKGKVLLGYHLYDSVYPASTTKLLTAYVALKYGNLTDTVTVKDTVSSLPWDSQKCGLRQNDRISLYDLLCGLLIYSGNDCGIAIAEHICGSEDAFVDLMNKEVWEIGATGTHYVNSHGLHSDEHYTTAYDLYLILRECMKFQTFNEIVSMDEYTAKIEHEGEQAKTLTWRSTNHYTAGETNLPENLTGLGGKTGYTDEAGSCLVYSCKDEAGNVYISVVMGARNTDLLYEQTNSLLSAGVL